MEEGASRIRRRICIRKRAWPGLESVCAAPAEAERAPGEDAAAEEKEEDAGAAGAAGRRRKTAQPAEERAAGSPGPVPTTLGRGPEEDPEPAPPPAQPAAGSTDQVRRVRVGGSSYHGAAIGRLDRSLLFSVWPLSAAAAAALPLSDGRGTPAAP